MKVFISFPMNGKSYNDLVIERNSIINICKEYFSDDVHYIDTIMKNPGDNPLYCLGKAIEALSEADVAVFAHGWDKARGCKIEFDCAEKYNIPIFII